MTAITRRKALATVPALVAVVAMPSEAAGGDEALLTRTAAFHEIYNVSTEAREQWHAEHDRVDALPDCPPNKPIPMGGYEAYSQFLTNHGVDALADRANDLTERSAKAALAVFATPAQTVHGAIEKLKIAYLAIGDGGGTRTGDIDLVAWHRGFDGLNWGHRRTGRFSGATRTWMLLGCAGCRRTRPCRSRVMTI
jgi:hypothetical protein